MATKPKKSVKPNKPAPKKGAPKKVAKPKKGAKPKSPALGTVRAGNLKRLAAAGFNAASWLPLHEPTSRLRSAREIAARASALVALFFWVAVPATSLSDKDLRARLDRDGLREALTDDERAILKLARERAHRENVDGIGWRLENMWPLAWVLGFEPVPSFDGAMIDGATIDAMLDFIGGKLGVDALLERATPRSNAEVVALEDLFYCAHNAARSAQLGSKTVPADFNPVVGGGVVHERRHALTWATSPGTAWDDTDLST
jgi:hypothetical protein